MVSSKRRDTFDSLRFQIRQHLPDINRKRSMAMGNEETPKGPPVPHTFCKSTRTKTQAASVVNGTPRTSGSTNVGEIGLDEDGKNFARPAGKLQSLVICPLVLGLGRRATPILKGRHSRPGAGGAYTCRRECSRDSRPSSRRRLRSARSTLIWRSVVRAIRPAILSAGARAAVARHMSWSK